MTEEQMKRRLYELFVHDQVMLRGYTMADVFAAMSKHGELHSRHTKTNENGETQIDIQGMFEDWVNEYDYQDLPGLFLVTFNEFRQANIDPYYVQNLLDKVPEEKEFCDACKKWLEIKE